MLPMPILLHLLRAANHLEDAYKVLLELASYVHNVSPCRHKVPSAFSKGSHTHLETLMLWAMKHQPTTL